MMLPPVPDEPCPIFVHDVTSFMCSIHNYKSGRGLAITWTPMRQPLFIYDGILQRKYVVGEEECIGRHNCGSGIHMVRAADLQYVRRN